MKAGRFQRNRNDEAPHAWPFKGKGSALIRRLILASIACKLPVRSPQRFRYCYPGCGLQMQSLVAKKREVNERQVLQNANGLLKGRSVSDFSRKMAARAICPHPTTLRTLCRRCYYG